MTEKTRTIQMDHLMDIPVPEGLYGSITGTLFIDGIDSLDSPHYRSAALIGSPDTVLALGIMYYDVALKKFQVQKAQQGLGGAWPFGAKVTAACGVEGGLAAFAGQDQGIPFVEVYHSPLSSGAPRPTAMIGRTATPLPSTVTTARARGLPVRSRTCWNGMESCTALSSPNRHNGTHSFTPTRCRTRLPR